uniref:Secreted MAC/Perforin/Torso-like protein n=1 Tax=Pristhesancus plagipennis TaxID=1955184 RepID=A0A2K8JSA0_PRIPG|nr:secreted MAC/Perforin/Torso-like protein [Pristhesancus plagipennis]
MSQMVAIITTFFRVMLLLVCIACLISHSRSHSLRVGGAINIFGRFGYLSISMRVVPRNDLDKWIFREPIVDVFKNVTENKRIEGKSENELLHDDFHMEFCDDVTQLLQAYFREFKIDRLDKPWRAFTASWTEVTIAKNLGLNVTYVNGDHCYVLVRLSKPRVVASLTKDFTPQSARFNEAVKSQASFLTAGNSASIHNFIRNFGSHYVASYVTGNSLYQVLVYTPKAYNVLKNRLQRENTGLSSLSSSEMTSLFSPWHAEHLGSVLAASGNPLVYEWASKELQLSAPPEHHARKRRSAPTSYISLLKLHDNPHLLSSLAPLMKNEALLKLKLTALAHVFEDEKTRNWFLSIIDNNLKLWELNM